MDREAVKMKILLLGSNGQVGWELQRSLASLGHLKACSRKEADFEHLKDLQATIRCYSPNLIVNAAAYTAVDKAESEPDSAHRVNTTAVGLLADEAKRLGALLIHYSTDYIFNGKKPAPYIETDQPNALNVYGKTKLQGEEAIQESGCKYLLFRTSWVYASRGSNFVRTMIRLAKEKNELNVVVDQIGTPTHADLIADVTALALAQYQNASEEEASRLHGIYHLASAGETSWYEYARYVIQLAEQRGLALQVKTSEVKPILSERYPVSAERPKSSRLNCEKLEKTFNLRLPDWRYHVRHAVMELIEQENNK